MSALPFRGARLVPNIAPLIVGDLAWAKRMIYCAKLVEFEPQPFDWRITRSASLALAAGPAGRGALQQPRPDMVAEKISVAHIGLQHVHRLVPRHVPHLEHRCAAARRAG